MGINTLHFAKSIKTLKKNQFIKYKFIPTGIGIILDIDSVNNCISVGTVFKQKGDLEAKIHKHIIRIQDAEFYKNNKEVPSYIKEAYIKFL